MKTIKRGDIWIVDFDPARGSEIQKARPAVVVQVDGITILPRALVVPITDWKAHYTPLSWMVRLDPTAENGLKKVSTVDALQERSADHSRFQKLIGKISHLDMKQVEEALAFCQGLILQKP